MPFYTIMKKSALRDWAIIQPILTDEFTDLRTLSKLSGVSPTSTQNAIAYAMDLGLLDFKYGSNPKDRSRIKTFVRKKQTQGQS